MKTLRSGASIIWTIVWKDLREFSRDRLWIVITPLSLAMVIGAFWLLPARVDETVPVGLYPPRLAKALKSLDAHGQDQSGGFEIVPFRKRDRLMAAVAGKGRQTGERRVSIGIAFPEDFEAATREGRRVAVNVYVDPAVPGRLRRAVSGQIREVAYALQALERGKKPEDALPVVLPDESTVVLGEDRAGAQVPLRDKLRPMMAVVILMMEALALAGLVAVEISQRTVTALLVTPARTAHLLAAKGITGAVLGMGQGLVFLLATRSFGSSPLFVTVLLLVGAVMMSAVGMIAGAAGRDFMSTLFAGFALIVPLMIPAFAVLLPGSPSLWVKAMPSYGIIRAMVECVAYGRPWSEMGTHLSLALAWCVALLGAALYLLKKKVEAL